MEEKKIKKKKLTVTVSSKKTPNIPFYQLNKQKTSVVIEKKVSRKKKIVGNKQISKIPKLEGQINYLRGVLKKQQEEETRKKEILKNIDPGINLLINNKFDMTLNEVKAELSKRLKSKLMA